MKKLLLTTVALVAIIAGANAQNFKKGDWTLGANVSNLDLGHSFAKDISVTSFDMTAAAGHFLSDKFAVGAGFGFDYVRSNKHTYSSDLTFMVNVRYYPIGNFFGLVGYGGYAPTGNDLRSQFCAAVGYDLFLSEKVFFEPSVTYSKRLVDGGVNALGLSLGIGVKFCPPHL